MKISADEVRRVAALARLGLGEDEVERLRGELEAILSYVAQLEELDVSGVEPTSHAVPLACPTREDRALPSTPREAILGRAPRQDGELFVVPRIIE